jgi:iron complex transport system substrate-binding protein
VIPARLVALLWLAMLAWQGCGLALAQTRVTVVDDRGRSVTIAQPVRRVVSLLPSLTESVCALQACDRLVGVDAFSNWPAQVQALPRLGGLEDTTIERLVGLKPDLVLAAASARALPRLEALGLRVLALEPASLADTHRVLEVLAQALGQPGDGERLWARIDQRLRDAASRVPPALRGQRVYFEVAAAPYAAGRASFVGEVLARLQLGNVVPAAMGPFPKLNPEFVVRAQPGIVMASARNLAEMPARPGWSTLQALKAGRSCGFDEPQYDLLVRPGPRLAEAGERIADCLVQLGGRQP